jgi:tripartite-type tricarboxylate transporter receptor subunit TctC
LNCASAGAGTPNHLGCEMLKAMAKVDFVHVPYKGATQGITDIVAGQAQFMFNSIPAVLPLAKAGKSGHSAWVDQSGRSLRRTCRPLPRLYRGFSA